MAHGRSLRSLVWRIAHGPKKTQQPFQRMCIGDQVGLLLDKVVNDIGSWKPAYS